MKKAKLYLAKKILCFLLVGCITSTSIFLSYGNTLTVKAESDYFETSELVRVVTSLCLVLYGVGGALQSGGLTVQTALTSLISIWGSVDAIAGMISDNGDGTYTVSDELLQSMQQVIQDVENSTFDSTDIMNMWRGSYNYTGTLYIGRDIYGNFQEDVLKISDFCETPVAGYLYTRSNSYVDDNGVAVETTDEDIIFGTVSNGGVYPESLTYVCSSYLDGEFSSTHTSSTSSHTIRATYSDSNGVSSDSYENMYCFNFPMFSSYESFENYMLTGTGYENALNYNKQYFDYSSYYNGTYSGGNFRVLSSTLSGLDAKITDVNSRLDDIDEQVKELQEYLNEIEEESGEDEEVEGSTWLEKIYNTLVKIYKKICSIRRWVIADTVIDGADLLFDILTEIGEMVVDLIVEPAVAFAYLASEISTLGSFLSKKFPFCIPWDVAFLLDFLKAEPKTPEFTLPLKIETYGIDEEIKISLEQFEIVSKISRIFLTLVFCRGLLDLSMKVVTVKQKEG